MQGKMERIFLLCFTFVEPFIMYITEENTQVHWSIVFSSASVKGTFIAFDFIVFTDAFRSMRFHGPKALRGCWSPWTGMEPGTRPFHCLEPTIFCLNPKANVMEP